MNAPGPAAQTIRDIIEANRYLVLATADATGRPWSSPVYFAHIATAESYSILAKDGHPDHRISVPLPRNS